MIANDVQTLAFAFSMFAGETLSALTKSGALTNNSAADLAENFAESVREFPIEPNAVKDQLSVIFDDAARNLRGGV